MSGAKSAAAMKRKKAKLAKSQADAAGKRVAGRPPKLTFGKTVTMEEVIGSCAEIGCTTKEIAAVLGVSEKTLFNRFQAEPMLREIYETRRALGHASLRRLARWHAERANSSGVQMLIYLLRTELGMKAEKERGDAGDDDNDNKPEGSRSDIFSDDILKDLSEEELLIIRKIKLKLFQPGDNARVIDGEIVPGSDRAGAGAAPDRGGGAEPAAGADQGERQPQEKAG